MAMNQREKYLAVGVGAVLALFIGQSVLSSIQGGFDKKKETIDSLEKKKTEQELQQTAGLVANDKLNAVVVRSLPKSEEKARADYMEFLIELGDEAKLSEPTPRFLGESPEKDTYQSLKFQLTGVGTIENATQLLYGFYKKNYLHRITRFDLRPVTNAKEANQLTISLDCEVLSLGIAKDKQPPPKEPSNRVAKSLEDYKYYILERNLFSPANNPPSLDANKVVDAKVGLRVEHSIEAKDLDQNQVLKYEIVGEAPAGLQLEKSTGKLVWTSKETGDYKVDVKVTDSGIPSRTAQQTVTFKVKEVPTPPPPPVQFDVASQAMVTALIAGKNGPEAWVLSKTESKTIYLRQGDQLKLGGVEGKVIEVGSNFVEFETAGRRWLVGLDETLADAYSRGQND